MAEFVAQSLAQIKSELENVAFLSIQEKRKILKKRERLEYRIRKRTKQENDFLLYIQYEKDLLQFFKMRKRDRGSKSRAEVPVIKRIHQLYQLCETRFPQSTDVWLQHIEFSKKQKEYGRVGRLFTQMLRTHSTEPELWVQAARWEVEQSNLDEARTLMQRCINANKTSIVAWVEFYRMELDIAKSMRGRTEEINESDPNQNGAIAELVSKHACQQCPDNLELLLSLIRVSEKFTFAGHLQKVLIQELKQNFSHVPSVWDFFARRHLPAKKKKMSRLRETQEKRFFDVFEEAVREIPTSEMWTLYLTAGLELLSARMADSDRLQRRMKRVFELFQTAADQNCLSIDMFPHWMALLSQGEDGEKKAREACDLMVERFPRKVEAWLECLQLHFVTLSSPQDVLACLDKAVDSLTTKELWEVWEPVLLYLSSTNYEDLETVIEKPCQSLTPELGMPARLFHLRWTMINKNIAATRDVFNKWYSFTVPVRFYLEYIQQELMEEKKKIDLIRRAFERAVTDYGKTDPDLWLEYIRVESKYGDAVLASGLGNRADLHLPRGPLRDHFFLRRSGLSLQ